LDIAAEDSFVTLRTYKTNFWPNKGRYYFKPIS